MKKLCLFLPLGLGLLFFFKSKNEALTSKKEESQNRTESDVGWPQRRGVVRGVRTEPKRYFGHVLERQNGEDLETKCCKAR